MVVRLFTFVMGVAAGFFAVTLWLNGAAPQPAFSVEYQLTRDVFKHVVAMFIAFGTMMLMFLVYGPP